MTGTKREGTRCLHSPPEFRADRRALASALHMSTQLVLALPSRLHFDSRMPLVAADYSYGGMGVEGMHAFWVPVLSGRKRGYGAPLGACEACGAFALGLCARRCLMIWNRPRSISSRTIFPHCRCERMLYSTAVEVVNARFGSGLHAGQPASGPSVCADCPGPRGCSSVCRAPPHHRVPSLHGAQ